MYDKDELETAILSYLDGKLLGKEPKNIRWYLSRFTFEMDHIDDLPLRSVTAAVKRLHKAGKIRNAMGAGWIFDPKGPVGHMAYVRDRI